MREITIIGPVTGRLYPALDTGETWNCSPVVAFRSPDMTALIQAGDGADSNDEGLRLQSGRFVDVTDGETAAIEMVTAEVGGDTLLLAIPDGRFWEEVTIAPNSTISGNSVKAESVTNPAGAGEAQA